MKMRKTALAALLLGSVVAMPAFAFTPGCPASQQTEGEGGAGSNWQSSPGAAAQRTEGEGGAGGNWQSPPGANAQKTAAAAGTQEAAVSPCN
jgi:hypothetical protein